MVMGVPAVTATSLRLAFDFGAGYLAATIMPVRRDMVRALEFASGGVLAHGHFIKRMVRLTHAASGRRGFSFWNSHDNTLSVYLYTANTLTGNKNPALLPAKPHIIAMNFKK